MAEQRKQRVSSRCADVARKISGIDVAKAGARADLRRAQQVFGLRVAGIGHLVVLVKRGDMPRDVDRDAGNKLGQPLQFIVGVVEAGNQQRDDLDPEAHFVQAANGVEDGLQAATQLAIVAVVEALQIDFVEVEPWAQVFEHLRSAVAVGDESGDAVRPLWLP